MSGKHRLSGGPRDRRTFLCLFDNKPNFDTIHSVAIFEYLRGTRAELKHVHWPSRAQTIAFTTVVVVMSLAVAIILAFFDYIFSYLLKLFI
jgi:preprotein translocase subunit SecE